MISHTAKDRAAAGDFSGYVLVVVCAFGQFFFNIFAVPDSGVMSRYNMTGENLLTLYTMVLGDFQRSDFQDEPELLVGFVSFMFIVVTNIGIGCMGSIQGQGDIYVKKMPTIGREA